VWEWIWCDVGGMGNETHHAECKKPHLFATFYTKNDHFPRQARDKYRETPKRGVFLQTRRATRPTPSCWCSETTRPGRCRNAQPRQRSSSRPQRRCTKRLLYYKRWCYQDRLGTIRGKALKTRRRFVQEWLIATLEVVKGLYPKCHWGYFAGPSQCAPYWPCARGSDGEWLCSFDHPTEV
jgi:hypothetical protein